MTKNQKDWRASTQLDAINQLQPFQPPLLVGIYAAAKRLSMSPQTVRKLISQGRLVCVPGIRKILIPEASLQEFVAAVR